MPKLVADQAIFEAVIKTVVRKGYAGATTREIADLAGVNEATLFRRYGSKEKLVIEAIAHVHRASGLEKVIVYTGDIRDDLLRILSSVFEGEEANIQMMMTMVSEIPRFPELQSATAGPSQTMMELGRLLARYQAEGILKPEHPLHAVLGLIGPIVMRHMLSRANPSLPLPASNLSNHIENYLTGRSV